MPGIWFGAFVQVGPSERRFGDSLLEDGPLILPFSDRVCSLVDSSGPFLFPLGTVIDRPIGLEIGSSSLSSLVRS